ncbi:group I truncated hemoglobin [Salinibacterium soli]|uniref:Group 1 truncated hemoglobin n=1 Tax=Antiquaquibacter soli TaxID=3064523 RepID=A0ABT9BQV7_9MICO|nr:group 1 truncated hemoglobin [Protaetiibacter sp. WY-16]MDO7882832.1 group 1 truncated hemoglobin [Protaetiibacter sp. WY-16]
MSVFDKLGGEAAIALAVDDFSARMTADPELAGWFEELDLEALKHHQRAFLAVALGGPEEYSGRSMRTAHAGLGITDHAYTRTVAHLADALTALGADPELVATVVRRVELMRAAIVDIR